MSEKKPVHSKLYVSRHRSWQESVANLLDAAKLADRLSREKRVLVKPNLVEALGPPVTTPVELVAAVVGYLREKAPALEVLVGEGCGAWEYETGRVFFELGYDPVAIDAHGAGVLKRDWRAIGHIRMVDGELGHAEGYEVIDVD